METAIEIKEGCRKLIIDFENMTIVQDIRNESENNLLVKRQFIYGLDELSSVLGVCRLTASKIAKTQLHGCYFISGKRKMVFDYCKVMERLNIC